MLPWQHANNPKIGGGQSFIAFTYILLYAERQTSFYPDVMDVDLVPRLSIMPTPSLTCIKHAVDRSNAMC